MRIRNLIVASIAALMAIVACEPETDLGLPSIKIDGDGTMAFEADKTAKSWEGSLNRLKNTFTDTIENIASSEAFKVIINSFETIVSGINKLTDSLGSLGSIALGAGLFTGIKNVGKRRSTMFHNCFEYADRDRCFLYEIGFLSPIVKYTLVNEATISVEII
jgi:hypothetical protein